jgi:C1A family cysteine protease
MLKEKLEGRTVRSFGMGYRRMSPEERRSYTTMLDTAGFTPPEAFDARDVVANQTACKAFAALNQGSCGSCYAFSAATAFSARMCRLGRASVGNIVLSPQEMIDCTNGCDGGNAIEVYNLLAKAPTSVELWCNPYTQRKDTCGSGMCKTGLTYGGEPKSVRTVGGAGPAGVLQMQLELMRGGPGVVSFDVYDDLYSYVSGVYVKSAAAKLMGAHAVALIGWGESRLARCGRPRNCQTERRLRRRRGGQGPLLAAAELVGLRLR